MKSNQPIYTPVRFSHLVSHAGPGAVIRGAEDRLMVMCDTRFWTDRDKKNATEVIPYVQRIIVALGLNVQLRMPPQAKEIENNQISGSYMPCVLFPRFAVCKKCGLLHKNPWQKQRVQFSENALCENCKSRLEQVTWCSVSNAGHLDEVPWHYICHKGGNSHCKEDHDDNYMEIYKTAEGTERVRCKREGCSSSGEINDDVRSFIDNIQPWLWEKIPQGDNKIDVQNMEINDPRVYSHDSQGGLVIPPESRISKQSIVDRLYNNSTLRRELDNARTPLRRKGIIRKMATQFRCSIEEIEDAFNDIEAGYPFYGHTLTPGDLLEDEYQALITPISNQQEDEDFVTNHKSNEWQNLAKTIEGNLRIISSLVDRLVVVERLREIKVFKGFSRYAGERKDDEERIVVRPDIIGKSDWLPAIELFGEGVFFTLNETILSKWERLESVHKRAGELARRFENSSRFGRQEVTITPRFLLLHTLSHLLIRELEVIAGYPAASLKERLYCSEARNMLGILIYTTSPDIAGTLGGIIDSGQPEKFMSLLSATFNKAQWCSLDPVCGEQEGQGPDWLNRAACHACALVPETSCDFGNVFLDRVFIKGSQAEGIPNLFDFLRPINV